MNVTLVNYGAGKEYKSGQTVCVGGFSFPVEENKVVHNENSKAGSQFYGQSEKCDKAFELACFAWEAQEFDAIENNN